MTKTSMARKAYLLFIAVSLAMAIGYDLSKIQMLWSLGWLFVILSTLLLLIEAVYKAIPSRGRVQRYASEEDYEGLLDEISRRFSRGESVSPREVEKRIFYFVNEEY